MIYECGKLEYCAIEKKNQNQNKIKQKNKNNKKTPPKPKTNLQGPHELGDSRWSCLKMKTGSSPEEQSEGTTGYTYTQIIQEASECLEDSHKTSCTHIQIKTSS